MKEFDILPKQDKRIVAQIININKFKNSTDEVYREKIKNQMAVLRPGISAKDLKRPELIKIADSYINKKA